MPAIASAPALLPKKYGAMFRRLLERNLFLAGSTAAQPPRVCVHARGSAALLEVTIWRRMSALGHKQTFRAAIGFALERAKFEWPLSFRSQSQGLFVQSCPLLPCGHRSDG